MTPDELKKQIADLNDIKIYSQKEVDAIAEKQANHALIIVIIFVFAAYALGIFITSLHCPCGLH